MASGKLLCTRGLKIGRCITTGRAELSSVTAHAPSESGEIRTLKSFDDIPAIPCYPLIGNVWAYLPFIGRFDPRKLDEAQMKKCKEMGKIVREDLTRSQPMVHLFDVKDIEKMARYEGKIPHRDPLLSLKLYRESNPELYTNGGLLANNGSQWYQMRSKVQAHLLKPRAIHSYQPQLDEVALELMNKIRLTRDDKHEVSNLMPDLYKWALESVSLIALETRLNCLSLNLPSDSDSSRMIEAVNFIFRLWFSLEFSTLKLWRYYPSSTHRRFVESMDVFSAISRKYIHEAKIRMDTDRNLEREATLLETFFYKEKMDERDATTMISDMLLGGIDTTSHSVAFTLYQLAMHPDVQEKAYQEVCKAVPDRQVQLKPEHLNDVRYLKACIKETLRLNPIVSATTRRLKEDIELSGYHIPAGVFIICHISVPSRLEENFKDADKFQPERWLRGQNLDKINPFASLPFSRGTRSCIGKRIAEQEMWTVMIRILQNYKIEYHYEEIGAYAGLVNRPNKPLRFRFLER